ncbi:glutaredoxin family protein [Rhodoferax ferrireducens]|uniref:glutaredoxin family protein n=1 Tax=Rhodoferax ferrireducens TaxID=192843 RepID=UPI000E0D754B|nr:glutaredoxin family protein [Rhodoferax ferrireducens]
MAGQAQAQTVYRVVGPDGKVTFSDKPPAASEQATATGAGGKPLGSGGTALPFELRQVASKYPVTLYTSSNCAPCGSGRALLSSRGIPFAEKTVSTSEDSDALQRISGESSLPFLTIGGQQIKGYSDAEWTQFLDAAGYPKASVLPASYRGPAATPLVAVQKPAPAAKPEETQAPRAPAAPSRPAVAPPANPAGITF